MAFKIALQSLSLSPFLSVSLPHSPPPPSLSPLFLSSLSVLNGWSAHLLLAFYEDPRIIHAESAKRLKLWKRLLPFYFYSFFIH